ncbi:uncharacterized protein LOC116138684 [Pistacia vera]|uniref:uncharacterized protein LOC116138684 n=1 Tax=Pistacia vera TaxID=55513 RepID=UPI001263D303|nr:uncharacterized protein LOC116138684 [Pistacia vera]
MNALSYELHIVVRKTRWFFAAGAATWFGYLYGFPFMGDDLKMRHAVSLLKSNNPLYKYWGAHRLARYAIDDERRMKIVEIVGAQELVNMLWDARDYYTRLQTLKALVALSGSDEAVGALHRGGAISVIKSTPQSLDGAKIFVRSTSQFSEAEIEKYESSLLKRFQDLRYDIIVRLV